MSKPTDGGTPTKKKHLNEGFGLEAFNPDSMRGDNYYKYLDLVEGKVVNEDDPLQRRSDSMNVNKQYVFEVYNVKPFEKRLFPRSTSDKTMIADGFDLRESKPKAITTTYLKDAILLNTALYAKIGGDNNNPIFYYMLQSPNSPHVKTSEK